MQGLFVFLHWKALNRHFDIRARHQSLSHDFRDINDTRDLISFPWSLSQIQIPWINEFKKNLRVSFVIWFV
jgi:hypothetical protein